MSRAHGLNISAVARRTGVGVDRIRKWEERYGVPRPVRTPSGQRRYAESQVILVEWLRDRVSEGYRIGDAVSLLRATQAPTPRAPRALQEAVVDAAQAGDAALVEILLEQSFEVYPLERNLAEVVEPALRRIGDAWAAAECSVVHEHLLSGAVRARLESALTHERPAERGTAVLACAPGERHELGLLMVALLMRRRGWNVLYLGPDTPAEEAVELATGVGAAVLGFSVTLEAFLEPLGSALERVGYPHGLRLLLGGAAMTRNRARALRGRFIRGPLAGVAGALARVTA